MALIKLLKNYPQTFWIANIIELFERWAFYGFFMLFANYLTKSTDLGGLGLSQEQKGTIMGVGTAILYFLPMITGSIADRFGYKKVLILAFTIYASAFLLFPYFTSYQGVFAMYIYLAIGAALFKPVISATIARTTDISNSSVGFGIFYMMVNIGAFIGPITSMLFQDTSYHIVFQISGFIILLNFILLFFYKVPNQNSTKGSLSSSIAAVFSNIIRVIVDFKFLLFLIIVAGFWSMYYQLFFTLPVYIEQWVDTSRMYEFFRANWPFIAEKFGRDGTMDAEFITNFDALYIILFQVSVSAIIMKIKPLKAMAAGFIVNAIGMALTFYTQNVSFLLISLFIFGIGEMMGSPKITEYIGLIAPSEKKAVYMGFSYIPVFIGSLLAGQISGTVYQNLSDKHSLTMRYAQENGIVVSTELTKQEYFTDVARQLHLSSNELTSILWQTYNPNRIWMVVLAIGLGAALLLLLYNRLVLNSKKAVDET